MCMCISGAKGWGRAQGWGWNEGGGGKVIWATNIEQQISTNVDQQI